MLLYVGIASCLSMFLLMALTVLYVPISCLSDVVYCAVVVEYVALHVDCYLLLLYINQLIFIVVCFACAVLRS